MSAYITTKDGRQVRSALQDYLDKKNLKILPDVSTQSAPKTSIIPRPDPVTAIPSSMASFKPLREQQTETVLAQQQPASSIVLAQSLEVSPSSSRTLSTTQPTSGGYKSVIDGLKVVFDSGLRAGVERKEPLLVYGERDIDAEGFNQRLLAYSPRDKHDFENYISYLKAEKEKRAQSAELKLNFSIQRKLPVAELIDLKNYADSTRSEVKFLDAMLRTYNDVQHANSPLDQSKKDVLLKIMSNLLDAFVTGKAYKAVPGKNRFGQTVAFKLQDAIGIIFKKPSTQGEVRDPILTLPTIENYFDGNRLIVGSKPIENERDLEIENTQNVGGLLHLLMKCSGGDPKVDLKIVQPFVGVGNGGVDLQMDLKNGYRVAKNSIKERHVSPKAFEAQMVLEQNQARSALAKYFIENPGELKKALKDPSAVAYLKKLMFVLVKGNPYDANAALVPSMVQNMSYSVQHVESVKDSQSQAWNKTAVNKDFYRDNPIDKQSNLEFYLNSSDKMYRSNDDPYGAWRQVVYDWSKQ